MCVTEGVCPLRVSSLEAYLLPSLPPTITVQDPSLQVLSLLRVLHALNTSWSCLYEVRHLIIAHD